jgi:XRE family transcriptional regulator, regulator of sulfur utilization
VEPVKLVGENLRAARTRRGLSLSEVARQAGIGKGTLSELEAGNRNPTLETLYALATVLGLPLGRLLAAEPEPRVGGALHIHRSAGPEISGHAADVELLDSVDDGRTRLEIYRLHVRAGTRYTSPAHHPRVIEQLHVHSGTLVTGPESDPHSLGPGDYIRFDATVPHVYEAPEDATTATLVMRYPT